MVFSGGHPTPIGGHLTSQGMWRQLGFIFNPKSPRNPFLTFLIRHFNTVTLDSLPPHLAYLLRPYSTFPFPYLFEVLSSLCTSDISTQWHLNCHSASFLIVVRITPGWSQREKGAHCVFTCRSAQPSEHYIVQDCFSLNFKSPFCLGALGQVPMKFQMG